MKYAYINSKNHHKIQYACFSVFRLVNLIVYKSEIVTSEESERTVYTWFWFYWVKAILFNFRIKHVNGAWAIFIIYLLTIFCNSDKIHQVSTRQWYLSKHQRETPNLINDSLLKINWLIFHTTFEKNFQQFERKTPKFSLKKQSKA